MRWRQKLSFYFFGRAMDRAGGLPDFLQLAALGRRHDRRFVAANYYRPTGFAWKQTFKKPRREPALVKLGQIALTDLLCLDRLSIIGLRYRIGILSPEDQEAIRGLEIAQIIGDCKVTPDLMFDLMLVQHVVEDWEGLKGASKAILNSGIDDSRLNELAADMLVQATYQLIAPKIFRNTLSEDDVASLKAAIKLTETVLGADHPKLAHYRGLLASVSGDLEKAVELHASASSQIGYTTQFFRAAANIIPICEIKAFAEQAPNLLPDDCWNLRHTDCHECTLLSTDQGYFSQYFEGFLESFSLVNPGALLHVHAVGFRPKLSRITALEGRFGVQINVTYDPQPTQRLSPDMFKGYCAGARYMYLPQYLDRYDRVIIHDIDGVLETSMSSVWQGREDIIMISSLVPDDNRRGHFAFWSNIGAGAFAITANQANWKFASALSKYLHNRFEACEQTGGRFFFTDQVGLLLATLAFKDDCTIVRMPAIFKQSSDTRGQRRERAKKEAQKKLLEKLRQS